MKITIEAETDGDRETLRKLHESEDPMVWKSVRQFLGAGFSAGVGGGGLPLTWFGDAPILLGFCESLRVSLDNANKRTA